MADTAALSINSKAADGKADPLIAGRANGQGASPVQAAPLASDDPVVAVPKAVLQSAPGRAALAAVLAGTQRANAAR